jgi:hypothetical protein
VSTQDFGKVPYWRDRCEAVMSGGGVVCQSRWWRRIESSYQEGGDRMSRVEARQSRGDGQAQIRVGVMSPGDDIAQVRVVKQEAGV